MTFTPLPHLLGLLSGTASLLMSSLDLDPRRVRRGPHSFAVEHLASNPKERSTGDLTIRGRELDKPGALVGQITLRQHPDGARRSELGPTGPSSHNKRTTIGPIQEAVAWAGLSGHGTVGIACSTDPPNCRIPVSRSRWPHTIQWAGAERPCRRPHREWRQGRSRTVPLDDAVGRPAHPHAPGGLGAVGWVGFCGRNV
jgi:hypothetical protein